MSEGLTRRRGAGGTSPNPSTGSGFDTSSPSNGSNSTLRTAAAKPTSAPSSSSSSNPNSRVGIAGIGPGQESGAYEGRGKVAFDPRDFESGSLSSEGTRMPRLTIMEEVLLLGLKDKQVRAGLFFLYEA